MSVFMHKPTHSHMRTRTQSKVQGNHAKHSYCCAVNQQSGACAPLRHSNLEQENPPGAGLITSQIEVTEPKVPQLHAAK